MEQFFFDGAKMEQSSDKLAMLLFHYILLCPKITKSKCAKKQLIKSILKIENTSKIKIKIIKMTIIEFRHLISS